MSEVIGYDDYKIKLRQLEDDFNKNVDDLRNKFKEYKIGLDVEFLDKNRLNKGDIIATENKTLKIKKFLEYKRQPSGRIAMIYEVERYTRQLKPSKQIEHPNFCYDLVLGQLNSYYSVKILKKGE